MGSRGTRRSRLPCRTMVVPRTRSTCTGYALWRSRGPRRANVWFFSLQHTFSVVRSAGQAVPNYKNPIRRDVVSTGSPGDNVTIRFRVRGLVDSIRWIYTARSLTTGRCGRRTTPAPGSSTATSTGTWRPGWGSCLRRTSRMSHPWILRLVSDVRCDAVGVV